MTHLAAMSDTRMPASDFEIISAFSSVVGGFLVVTSLLSLVILRGAMTEGRGGEDVLLQQSTTITKYKDAHKDNKQPIGTVSPARDARSDMLVGHVWLTWLLGIRRKC